jgi:hypothetical protein
MFNASLATMMKIRFDHALILLALTCLLTIDAQFNPASASPNVSDMHQESAKADKLKLISDEDKIDNFIARNKIRSSQAREKYVKHMHAIGFSSLMNPSRVRKDINLVETKSILASARSGLAEHKKDTIASMNEAINDIKNLDISAKARKDLLSDFDKSALGIPLRFEKYCELEYKIFAKMEEAITYLSSNRKAWGILDSKYQFVKKADEDRYDAYISDINKLIDQQNSLIFESEVASN